MDSCRIVSQCPPTPSVQTLSHKLKVTSCQRKERKKLAFGYTRVSTRNQEEEGGSLHEQAARIRVYAAQNDFDLRGIYEDVEPVLKREAQVEVTSSMVPGARAK
jgi:hypothetical protein